MNIHDFQKKKQQQQKISMLTCYDYPSACIIAETELDCVLVGDSVAMVVHGHSSTLMASVDMMVLHTQAVARALKKQFIVADMPFLSHKGSLSDVVGDVKRLLQAGAHAVKIEGADQQTCDRIQFLVSSGIPVMGHIGLTPQSVHQLGGYKVQGKTAEHGEKLLQQGKQLEAAGCFALVIECVPQALAQRITQSLSIPTIGIGASQYTDGQVLVWHDMLGLQTDFKPRFLKQYAQGKELFLQAIHHYDAQVKQAHFPAPEHCY